MESRTRDLQEAYQQLEAAQAHLVQSSKLASLGELAAGMAHEINNPMTIIMNYVELLLDEVENNQEAKEYCREILSTGHRISAILKDLLTFARQDSQKYTTASIPELLDKVLSFIIKRLEKEGIQVKKQYDPDLPFISVRKGQLEQVFLNLIINAKDALLEKSASKLKGREKILSISISKQQKGSAKFMQIILECA